MEVIFPAVRKGRGGGGGSSHFDHSFVRTCQPVPQTRVLVCTINCAGEEGTPQALDLSFGGLGALAVGNCIAAQRRAFGCCLRRREGIG